MYKCLLPAKNGLFLALTAVPLINTDQHQALKKVAKYVVWPSSKLRRGFTIATEAVNFLREVFSRLLNTSNLYLSVAKWIERLLLKRFIWARFPVGLNQRL